MSRPPPSTAYPPLPRGISHMPPFPQLLHVQDTPQPARHDSISSEHHDYHSEEEDEDADHEYNSPGHRDVKRESLGSMSKEATPSGMRKPHATRRRVVQSCSECRRRKIKCDKKFPCGPCILRSDQARCHEVGMAEKTVVSNSSNYATTSDLAALAHRLDALESSLIKSGALLPADLERYLKGTREQMAKLQPTPTYGVPNIPDKAPPLAEEETVDDTEGAALTLEHLAFGRSRMDGGHSLPHFALRYPSAVGRSAPNQGYHLARTAASHSPLGAMAGISPGGQVQGGPGLGHDVTIRNNPLGHGQSPLGREERKRQIDQLLELMGPTDVFELVYRQTDVVLKALTKVIPTRERGEILVRAYLDRVDWLHRCIHVPTFLQSCEDLWALPIDSVVHEISLPFISLYLAVCTLGLQFMESAECAKHFTPEEVNTLPDLWYNSARSALWGADFMANHTLEAIQCVVLMMVYMNNRDRADAAWALLGACVKMAQGLGLSRLGAEQQSVDGKPLPMWTGRWSSVIQREVGRRIWWNLVHLDWMMAPSYNYTTSIQADQSTSLKTALPSNVNDEDIIDGQPLNPKPIHVRTSISFQLARLKFAEIAHRQIWQANNNPHPPYSFILSVDGDFRKAMMELPAFFQPDPNTRAPSADDPKALVQHYEKIMLNLAIHSRMLRLHRPWLSRGYEDERFAYSKEQCIRAARASLRMMGENSNGTAEFLEKWWIPLFYVSVSGLVVIIDLLRTPRRHMHSTETEQKIQEVKGALNQMRRIANISHPSRAAVKVMDFLMAEVEERRRPSTLKRKASGDPGEDEESSDLQRAVKKLIRQAQLEADSPNQSLGSGNTPTPGASVPTGWSPKTSREMDMRIFSDTPRDRPVFDAYPMPPPQPQMDAVNGRATEQSGLHAPNQQMVATSPFTFPVDPTNATFQSFDPRAFGTTQQPQLDPAVESILSNYFPQPQTTSNTAGAANGQQVPEDFLSKVFNFGWDMSGSNQGMQPQPQGMQQQGGEAENGNMAMPMDGMNMANGLFDGWSAHGWMA